MLLLGAGRSQVQILSPRCDARTRQDAEGREKNNRDARRRVAAACLTHRRLRMQGECTARQLARLDIRLSSGCGVDSDRSGGAVHVTGELSNWGALVERHPVIERHEVEVRTWLAVDGHLSPPRSGGVVRDRNLAVRSV